MKLPRIERYNQFVWALVGTGFIVLFANEMFNHLSGIMYRYTHSDGSLPIATVVDTSNDNGKSTSSANYEFCAPIGIDDTPYQLIRIASDKFITRKVSVEKRPERMIRKYSSSYESYSPSYQQTCEEVEGNYNAVVNVLIRNANTGTMSLALPQNAVIYSLEFPKKHDTGSSDDQFPPASILYWEIITKDSNGDGVLDSKDDVGAYLSDLDGQNLRRITPVESRVVGKVYDKKRNTLLITVLRDTNGDKTLDENDDPSLVESSVSSRTILRDVLDKKMMMDIIKTAEPIKPVESKRNNNQG